ncbi:MAG: hypothetical protein ROR55_21385 [Devosia sp.]
MSVVQIRLQGDGINRMVYAAEALGKRGRREFSRGLHAGGKKTNTEVKKALVSQTAIKRRPIDNRVKGRVQDMLTYVITASGKGVPIKDVRSVKGGRGSGRDRKKLRKHIAGRQPRDDIGRFAKWSKADRLRAQEEARGFVGNNVTTTVWKDDRTFFQSFRSGKDTFVAIRRNGRFQNLYGPSPAKEAVKDESKQAFDLGLPLVQKRIHKRIVKITKGAVS